MGYSTRAKRVKGRRPAPTAATTRSAPVRSCLGEGLDALLDEAQELGEDLGGVVARGVFGALAGDEEDGGRERGGVHLACAVGHLGGQGPSLGDLEACLAHGVHEGGPAEGGLVGVDDDHGGVGLEDALGLAGAPGHLLLVEDGGGLLGGLALAVAVGGDDGLCFFRGEVGGVERGEDVLEGALVPDVEEVGQVCVRDVVVVGRVGDHRVERVVFEGEALCLASDHGRGSSKGGGGAWRVG